MKKGLVLLFVVLALSAGIDDWSVGSREIPEKAEILFVLHGGHLFFEADAVIIDMPVSEVLYFSDRPERKAGHIKLKDLVANWDKGDDSFAADNPNIVISFDLDGKPVDMTFEVKNPVLDERTLRFTIEKTLQEDLPIQETFPYPNPVIFMDGHGCWVFGC